MTTWNWTDFSGGMSDDSFLGRKGEFLDCENVDIIKNVRYVSGAYEIGLPTELGSSLGQEVVAVKDGIYPAFATSSYTYIGGQDTTANAAGAYLIQQIGTTSLPVTFFFQNGAIKQVKYNGASATTIGNITVNVPSGIPTATTIGAGRIYFAVANKIYVLLTNSVDPSTTICTVNATAGSSTIPFGYVIKYMYLYNDVLTVVANSNNSTHIYQLTESSTPDIWNIRYTHKISGVLAIGGCGENNNVFWFSTKSLYLTNGTESQKLKVVGKDEGGMSFASTSVATILDSIVYIADDTDVWEYGAIKPGYNRVLTRHSKRLDVTAIDGDIVCYYAGGKAYWDRISNQDTLTDNWSVTSLPYEAGMFNQPKTNTAIRVGHILPSYASYSSTSTLASLDIAVLTDEMEQNGDTEVVVRTITTQTSGLAPRYSDISIGEISDALSAEGYSSDFQYIKLVVNGNGGDPSVVTGFGTAFFRKTPKLFGFNLVHNDILGNQ